MSIDKAIEVILRLNDTSFKSALGSAQSQLRSFGDNMTRIGQTASVAFLGLGAVVVASANSFREFEAGMSNISTIVDTSKESIAAMGDEVLDLAKRMPVGINDLVAGLYDLRSANIDGAHAMEALEASAKLGVAGLGSTAESVDLMTTAMNAFSDEGLSSNTIADTLFKTTQYGKNTISELSEAFGATAPLVKGAGVSLADFLSATSALTAGGIPASESMNGVRAAVVALKKPTEEMDKVFKALHVSSGPELIKVSGNLVNAFKAVQDEAARLGIPLEKVTGRIEGANAIMSLAGNTNGIYAKSLADMTSGVNSLDQAFAKQAGTFNSAIQLMINNVQVFAIQIGAAMAPALTVAANAIKSVADWFTKLPEPVKQFIAAGLLATTVITGIVAGATLLIGSIAGSIASIISLVAVVGGWIAANSAVIASTLTMASLIGALFLPLVLGIAAAVTAVAVAWNTNFLGIQNITKQTVNFVGAVMGDLFSTIGKWLQQAWQWSVKTFNDIGNALAPFIKSAGNALGSFFNWLGGLLNSLFKGVLGVIGGIANAILSDLVHTAKLAANIVNPFLASLSLPTVNVDAMVGSIKIATDNALKYFKDKWADAGKLAISIPRVAAKSSSSPGNTPGASQGGNPYVAPSDADKKKASDAEQKRQAELLKNVTETLSNALKANKQAMDEVIVNMGAYVTEGEKLSAQLIKLDKDEQTLLATRSKLASMHLSGEAEKSRLKALQDVNEQIRQNAIDEKQAQNDLAKYKIEKNLDNTLQANESVYDALIAKTSAYATEAMKLSTNLIKLKADENALKNTRAEMVRQGSTLAELDEINKKIQKNGDEQKKTIGDIARAEEKARVERLNAEQKFNETKARLANEFADRADEHELRGLQDALNRKLISQRTYNTEVDRIRDNQVVREKALIDMQIKGLQDQLAIKSQGNVVTAETKGLEEQIYTLQQQQHALDQQRTNTKKENNAALAADDPFSLVSFLNSSQQAIDSFNQNFVQGILSGNLQISESFKNLGISILSDFSNKVFKNLSNEAFTFARAVVTGNKTMEDGTTKAATGLAASMHGIFSKLGDSISDVFGKMVKTGISAFKEMFTVQKLAAAKAALLTAHQGALNAWNATILIPFIGPVLAPIAYAGALAFGLAKSAVIGAMSFAVGTPEIPSDMLANVHQGEMIIPATFAQGIRSGDLTLGGPGQKSQPERPSVTVNVNFDGAQFYGDMERMISEIEKRLVEKLNIVGGRLALGEL